jgi:hypothetical protein
MARGSPDWQPWNAVQRFSGTGGAVPFEQKITSPAETVEGAPTEQEIELCKGFISRVWVRFPSGPVGLLHVCIYDEATKLWPGASGQYFTGDNEVIEFNVEYDVPLVGSDYKLTIKAWNEDDAYPHSALVRVWVVQLP